MRTNLITYNSESVQNWYGNLKGLSAAEKRIFEHFSEKIKNASFLDIGIGGGRTTEALLPLCKTYTGIDYAQAFVDQCKNKFPGTEFKTIDARDLSHFQNESFDFVNFSYNGIDYVNNKDRNQILSEAYRVLKPQGVFFFSTHNKAHISFDKKPWSDPYKSLMYNLKTFIRFAPFYFKKILGRKMELRNDEYAQIIDHAHYYGLITFYTSPEYLRKQLKENKFSDIHMYGMDGTEKSDKDLSEWIYVTAVKNDS